jgi:hypothetical protein
MLNSTPDTCTPCFVAFKADQAIQAVIYEAVVAQKDRNHASAELYRWAWGIHDQHRAEAIKLHDEFWGEDSSHHLLTQPDAGGEFR